MLLHRSHTERSHGQTANLPHETENTNSPFTLFPVDLRIIKKFSEKNAPRRTITRRRMLYCQKEDKSFHDVRLV